MDSNDDSTFTFTTKLWKRSQNSYATTIPQQILLLKNAPTENGEVVWSVNPDTGKVELSFKERDNDE